MFGILNVCEALISRVRSISEAKVVILLKESRVFVVPGIAEVVLAVPFPVVVAVGGFVVVVEVFGPVAKVKNFSYFSGTKCRVYVLRYLHSCHRFCVVSDLP